MKICVLFLFLIINQSIGHCQAPEYSYDKIVKKITENTWWGYKSCYNDTCDSNKLHPYFYATIGDTSDDDFYRKKIINNRTNRRIRPIMPTTWGEDKDKKNVLIYDWVPEICFIDSDVINNTYKIFIPFWEAWNAEMIFTTDSEFYIKYIDTTYDKKIYLLTKYFKLRGKYTSLDDHEYHAPK